MPYNISPRIKVALYPNFLSTQPPYVKHAIGYALSSPPSIKSHCSFFPDMDMGTREPLTRNKLLADPTIATVRCGEWFGNVYSRHRGDHKRNPNRRDPVSEGPIYRRRGWEYHTQRKNSTVTNANGSSDCRSVRPEALVTWSSRARNERFRKNFAIP